RGVIRAALRRPPDHRRCRVIRGPPLTNPRYAPSPRRYRNPRTDPRARPVRRGVATVCYPLAPIPPRQMAARLPMHALSVKALTKTYKNGVQALKGIDLEVEQGD